MLLSLFLLLLFLLYSPPILFSRPNCLSASSQLLPTTLRSLVRPRCLLGFFSLHRKEGLATEIFLLVQGCSLRACFILQLVPVAGEEIERASGSRGGGPWKATASPAAPWRTAAGRWWTGS